MCRVAGSGSLIDVTDTATSPDAQDGLPPPAWWVRGLNLRERLAAPDAPAPAPAATGGPAPWSVGDRAGFAARLTSLGIGEDTVRALAQEPAERLAARVPKPDWAVRVEQAVARAPERPVDVVVPEAAAGAGVFRPALQSLIDAAWEQVAARTAPDAPGVELDAVRAAFEERLGERLTGLAARTLVTELHRARTGDGLGGDTPRERFAAFLSGLGTRRGLAGLCTRYPVLVRMLGQSCHYAARAMAELLERFAADRPALVTELLDGVDPGALVRVDLGRGDAHQENRSVALLRFAGGATVVYKPRTLDQHALLDRAVEWLNGRVPGLRLRTPRSVAKTGYGWLEFIEHHGCASVTEVDRFYRRQGALLALLYAIDGSDMHYENVIACGDQPVLVDAETLLHSGLPPATTAGSDPAAEALNASVHRTCLLPTLLIGENGALDLSALGGADGASFPSDGVRWENAGTDEMRLVRGPVETSPGQNRPVLAGRGALHADHRPALLEGFRAGYDALCEHRAEFLSDSGPMARGADARGRLIVRPTRLYATLLEESTHPDALRDALARDAVFSVLWTESAGDPARQRLIEEETADLWRGDVPIFFHRPAQTAVWSAREERLDGVLTRPSLRIVREKIAAMGEVDRYDQEWVISASLAVSSANHGLAGPRSEMAVQPAPAVAPEPSRLLTAACGLADEIAARAVHGDGRANWIGLEQVAEAHWAVLPMGAGLAQGYCGVALFLAQLGTLANAERYTELARKALRPLPELLAALTAEPALAAAVGPGSLHGLGGIVYTLARVSELLGEESGTCLPQALTALEAAVGAGGADPARFDARSDGLADGLAGALAASLAAQEVKSADGAAELSRRLADRLRDRVADRTGTGGPGFAHGDAGIGWALLRYAATARDTGAADARAHAAAGAELLRSALTAALRSPGDLTWYSGLAGTASAAADVPGVLGQDIPGCELDRCVHLLNSGTPSDDLSPRLGALGTLEALTALAARGHEKARAVATRRAGEVLGTLEHQGHRCGTPDHVPSPGLLTGLSGIGYGLLRLAFPDRVPSALLLGTAAGAPGSLCTVR